MKTLSHLHAGSYCGQLVFGQGYMQLISEHLVKVLRGLHQYLLNLSLRAAMGEGVVINKGNKLDQGLRTTKRSNGSSAYALTKASLKMSPAGNPHRANSKVVE